MNEAVAPLALGAVTFVALLLLLPGVGDDEPVDLVPVDEGEADAASDRDGADGSDQVLPPHPGPVADPAPPSTPEPEPEPQAQPEPPTQEQPGRESRLVWPFDEGIRGSRFAAVDPNQTQGAGDPLAAEITWEGTGIGVSAGGCNGCPGLIDTFAPGPRFGQEGYNATAVTFLAFDTQGRLYASNADAALRGLFERHPDYRQLPDGTWYLGEGEPPEGTQELPLFKQDARDLLAGHPEGGVASTVTGRFSWFVGDDLVLTARIDALVQAP